MGRLTNLSSMLPTLGVKARYDEGRTDDQRRGSARARGYTTKWDKAAKAHLSDHPLCRYCELGAFGQAPRVTAATLVDHIVPHRGDQALFWSRRNWASACKACHDGPKQALEARGPDAVAAFADHLADLRPR